jgi:hypothetical protein
MRARVSGLLYIHEGFPRNLSPGHAHLMEMDAAGAFFRRSQDRYHIIARIAMGARSAHLVRARGGGGGGGGFGEGAS